MYERGQKIRVIKAHPRFPNYTAYRKFSSGKDGCYQIQRPSHFSDAIVVILVDPHSGKRLGSWDYLVHKDCIAPWEMGDVNLEDWL